MRNPVRALVRTAATLSALLALPMVLLVVTPSTAAAQVGPAARAEANIVPFGLFGPVGLVAIALGVIGMVVGVVRQRRRARESAEAELAASQATTRPLLMPVDTHS